MSCQVKFPLQDVVLLLRDKINPEVIGAVPEEKLEEEVLAFIQPKIDELQEQLDNLPDEIYVVSQELDGFVLETTLNTGTVIRVDLANLFGDLATLITSNKTSLVNAINEIFSLVKPIETISDMLAIKNPFNAQKVYVNSYHTPNYALLKPYKGGGTFIYDSSKANANDGVITFNGWVRQSVEINAYDAGAKGDGTTDDSAAIQRLFNAVNYAKFGEDTFLVNTPIDNKTCRFEGAGVGKTIFKAGADIDYIFKLSAQTLRFSGFTINADKKAKNCILLQNANGTVIDSCEIINAKRSGVKLSATGNNSNTTIRNCLIRWHGTKTSLSGTTTSDGFSYSFTDTVTIDNNVDYIATSNKAVSITGLSGSTFKTLESLSTTDAKTLLQGSGIEILRNGDNSRTNIYNCTIQGCAVAAVDDHSLYGANVYNNTFEYNSFGNTIGRRDISGNHEVVYQANNYANYCEANTYGDICVELGSGTMIGKSVTPLVANGIVKLNDTAPVLNIVSTGKKEELVNISTVTLEYGKDYYFTQSAAANDFNINLPPLTDDMRALSKYQLLSIKLIFGDIGGKTAKVYNINGGNQIASTSQSYTAFEFVLYGNIWVKKV